MADKFLQTLGELVNKGYAIAQARKNRLPVMIMRGADAMTEDGVVGEYHETPAISGLDKRGPIGVDAVRLSKAFNDSPIAIVAGGYDNSQAREGVLHESIHHQTDKDFYGGIKEIPDEYAEYVLSNLSGPGQKLREKVERLYGSKDFPQVTMNEMISFAGSSGTQDGAQTLYEINRFLRDKLADKKSQPLQNVIDLPGGVVTEGVRERLSFDQMIDRIGKQVVQPVGVMRMVTRR